MSYTGAILNAIGQWKPITFDDAKTKFNNYKMQNPDADDKTMLTDIYQGLSQEKAGWLVEIFDYDNNSLDSDEIGLMQLHISKAYGCGDKDTVDYNDIVNVEKYTGREALRELGDRYCTEG